jgi:hypothetical protein
VTSLHASDGCNGALRPVGGRNLLGNASNAGRQNSTLFLQPQDIGSLIPPFNLYCRHLPGADVKRQRFSGYDSAPAEHCQHSSAH